MPLSKKQQDTIRHLEDFRHITEPADIINWCEQQMQKPRKTARRRKLRQPNLRKESRQYYRDIIEALK